MRCYNANAARLLIGCLLIEPKFVYDGKHNLDKDDFAECEFHLRLFQAIKHLASHGANGIDAVDIYGTCDSRQDIKEIFDDNNLTDFIDTVKALANISNVQMYYDNVKKCSLLNKYQDNGFNISQFESDIEKHTIEEIVTYYDAIQEQIKASYYADKNVIERKAGDGWDRVKEEFKQDPMFGASTFSQLVNECVRGWIRGQLTVYTASSGSGKTAIGLYNLALVCCKRMWSYEQESYIDNPCYQHHGGLYIQYELDVDKELTPKILASISGVPCYHILDGRYEGDEESRVDEAIKILNESNIRFITMPNYTVPMLQTYIRQYANLYDCKYVVLDYISENLSLTNDYASNSKTKMRTDQVLTAVSTTLKNLSTELGIAIMAFTQTNANANNDGEVDASVISGARAIQNVCDVCGFLGKIKKKDEAVVEMMTERGKFNTNVVPNRCLSLFKMRFSKYPQGTKVFYNIDLNTGRIVDCFCTESNNQPLDVSKLTLNYTRG